MATIDRAIMIASIAHAGQKDKAGKPYILHPLRVMLTVASDKNATDEQKIVAVLHDVIEDTYVQEQQLKENGFSEDIINAKEAGLALSQELAKKVAADSQGLSLPDIGM